MAGKNIYGVLAEWDADTVQLPNEPFRRLTRTAEIERLPDAQGSGQGSDAG